MASEASGIQLRHIRYFLAVTEELHFGRAAKRLGIAQPPLSRAIRTLEEEVGVPLLTRSSRVVALTPAGEAFADAARRVLATVDVGVAEARRAAGLGSALRIGCLPTTPLERLRRFVRALEECEPEIQPQVTHLLSREQVHRLQLGGLDLGIVFAAGDEPGIEIEPLFAGEPVVALMAPEHRLAAKEVLGPDDLRDEVFVIFERAARPAIYDQWRAMIEAAGFSFRSVRELDTVNPRDLMLEVAAGSAIMFGAPSFPASDADSIIAVRRLEPAMWLPDTMLAWRADAPPHLRPVIAAVREVARGIHQASLRDRDPG